MVFVCIQKTSTIIYRYGLWPSRASSALSRHFHPARRSSPSLRKFPSIRSNPSRLFVAIVTMKRARETEVEMPVDVAAGHAMAAWMTPPPAARGHHYRQQSLHQQTPARVALFQAGTTRSVAESISPWKQQHHVRAQPAHKRCRDRSVPMGTRARPRLLTRGCASLCLTRRDNRISQTQTR